MTALSDTNTMLTADQISEANEIVLENTFVKEPMRMDMEAHGHLLTITFDDKPATPKDKPEIKDNTKVLSRTFTRALRLIDDGANMALENALPQAHQTLAREQTTRAPFASIYGSTGLLKTSPRLDVDTQIVMVGSAFKWLPATTVAVFGE